MSSCVDSGLDAARRTSAPPALSSRASTAVSAVTCRHATMVSPAKGRWPANRGISPDIKGMARCA